MKLYLIRHGMTKGNKRKAYIGAGTDEPLCEEGMAQLQTKSYPGADIVFVSPMRRCIMTAERIYPNQKMVVCEGLKEIDFGSFEGKNYEELKNEPAYISWMESGGEIAFPNGEVRRDFVLRTQNAFRECMKKVHQREIESVAFVVHGGTIMAIMEAYGIPKGEYYRWQIKNGELIQMDIKLIKRNNISENSRNSLKECEDTTDIIYVRSIVSQNS
ncbi:MAG: histidine phosphatase family protein [Lachnospiraceae bacterium]|nr:histidine phosphatase family protein [Lachnospiraceae bacterium]